LPVLNRIRFHVKISKNSIKEDKQMDDTVLKIALASFPYRMKGDRIQKENIDIKKTGGRNV